MNHLQAMDYLKTGIGLRAFGQRDPLVEYKEAAHRAFSELTSSMYEDFLRTLLRLRIAAPWSRKSRRPRWQGELPRPRPLFPKKYHRRPRRSSHTGNRWPVAEARGDGEAEDVSQR